MPGLSVTLDPPLTVGHDRGRPGRYAASFLQCSLASNCASARPGELTSQPKKRTRLKYRRSWWHPCRLGWSSCPQRRSGSSGRRLHHTCDSWGWSTYSMQPAVYQHPPVRCSLLNRLRVDTLIQYGSFFLSVSTSPASSAASARPA